MKNVSDFLFVSVFIVEVKFLVSENPFFYVANQKCIKCDVTNFLNGLRRKQKLKEI
jgi:hypothetical protein